MLNKRQTLADVSLMSEEKEGLDHVGIGEKISSTVHVFNTKSIIVIEGHQLLQT